MRNESKVKDTPSYWLGIFCLIPAVGFFVGLGMMLTGILKYKDRLYSIIGGAGLILNLGICLFPFYSLRYGKSTAEGFAKISQGRLNNIAKQVEIYKSLNGNYPDSLLQLRTLNDKIDIVDPLQIRRLNNSIKTFYEYQKIGEKYTLFSVGIDGIPNTSDDIYPVIIGVDSSKFGLIKR